MMRALAKERELRQQSAAQVRTEVEGVTETGDSGKGAAAGEGAVKRRPGAVGVPVRQGAADSDFVLCHPRLPRMAQWITVYGLVVMPMLWVAGLSILKPSAESRIPSTPNSCNGPKTS